MVIQMKMPKKWQLKLFIGRNKVKVKELKEMLSEHNDENDVVFYNLQNCNLEQYMLESIINADNQTEITTTNEIYVFHEGEE